MGLKPPPKKSLEDKNAMRNDLRRLGSVPAYKVLKEHGFNASLNLVTRLKQRS